MLPTTATPVAMLGQSRVKPSVYLRPTAQAISSNPAMKRTTQAILSPGCCRVVPTVTLGPEGRPAGVLSSKTIWVYSREQRSSWRPCRAPAAWQSRSVDSDADRVYRRDNDARAIGLSLIHI